MRSEGADAHEAAHYPIRIGQRHVSARSMRSLGSVLVLFLFGVSACCHATSNATARDGGIANLRVDGAVIGPVATIADEAVASARELFALVAADRAAVLGQAGTAVIALRLFELLPRHPVVTVATVMRLVETTNPTAGRAIEQLAAAGVLVETTGKKRDRSFVYQRYLDRLRVGTALDLHAQ
jgi:hypothetical protein